MTSPDLADEIRAAWASIRSDIDTTPIAVMHRLLRAARRVEQLSDAFLAEHGASRHEFELLMMLRRSDAPQTPSQLTEALLFSSPATSKRLSSLQDRGLLTRTPNPHDRRGALIGLTPAGVDFVDRVFPQQVAEEARMLAPLDPAEQARVAAALQALLRALPGGQDSPGEHPVNSQF